ncbi:hypothetical protein [Rivibacter subsaxonicus]|uniref:hypothetical protein n=1 Tax=Rivibacter subsaxonicus TaxID=457575 RepID=UPI00102AB789|nr:hypothetical protein [Rivibacter subsaxonicus]
MQSALAFIALVGFGLSLLVHACALMGVDVSANVPYVWSLHVGLFVVFIPFVLMSRRTLGAKPRLVDIRSVMPTWAFVLGLVLTAYVPLNFLLTLAISEGGQPSIREGKFVLQIHGHVIRELTSAEYAIHQANVMRALSGHWLVFYYVPFAYFMFREGSNSPSERSTRTR